MPLPRDLEPTRGSATFTDSVELVDASGALNGWRLDFSLVSSAEGADWTSGSVRLVLTDETVVDDEDETVNVAFTNLRIPFNEAPTAQAAFAKLKAIGDAVVDNIVPTVSPPAP